MSLLFLEVIKLLSNFYLDSYGFILDVYFAIYAFHKESEHIYQFSDDAKTLFTQISDANVDKTMTLWETDIGSSKNYSKEKRNLARYIFHLILAVILCSSKAIKNNKTIRV